jgi:hypothetical protein
MKRVLIALAVAVCLLPSTSEAQDQQTDSFPIPGCGSTLNVSNASAQFGPYNWLQYNVQTNVDFNLCVFIVSVSAYTAGVDGSALSASGTFSASVTKQVPVPYYGTWTTNGTHSSATSIPFVFITANTTSQATVVAPPDPEPDPDPPCDGEIDPDSGRCIPNYDPIIIDMDRKNYQLVSMENGVLFDLKGDGNVRRLGWTKEGSNEAFLALDRNGNGRIDDGTELFGSQTPVLGGCATAPNGFEALKFLIPLTVGGDVLDARSPAWSQLLLWTDRNHNGISEPDEIVRLADSDIAAINLVYKDSHRKDASGNWFRERADLVWKDGRTTKVYDIWLTMK